MKLKMKLAQAYMKEVKESREREERDNREREGRDSSLGRYNNITSGDSTTHVQTHGVATVTITNIDNNLSDMKLSAVPAVTPNDNYQEQLGKEPADVDSITKYEQNTSQDMEKKWVQQSQEKENVECHCKSCGSRCFVSDPYNFRCSNCNVKYTSLPTHMIADPLQCIGCLDTFPHKPAMKAHQSSADKERPFRCCKCGYEFRQKAHLQKHQWRIHRRKLEPDPNVKEAEAILQAVSGLPMPVQEDQTTLTIQDIIDRGVEHEIQKDFQQPDTASFQPQDGSKP